MNPQKEPKIKTYVAHGLSSDPLYQNYKAIKERCYNENAKSYKYYGANGVTMCDEWKLNFKTFHEWAYSNGYEKGKVITRENDEGNYSPENCSCKTRVANNIEMRNRGNQHKLSDKYKLDKEIV